VPGGMVTLIKSSSWRPGLNSLVNILAGGVGLNLASGVTPNEFNFRTKVSLRIE
jgi:hypothetical protein